MVTIELHCNVGDTVYAVIPGRPNPAFRLVKSIKIAKTGILYELQNLRTNETEFCKGEVFNKTVFARLEDAENAMKCK